MVTDGSVVWVRLKAIFAAPAALAVTLYGPPGVD
jgi:hypothetical protein